MAERIRGEVMALEIIRVLTKGGKYHAPTRLVRCTECGAEFARTGWLRDIVKSRGCASCHLRRLNREWAERRGWYLDIDEAALDAFSP